MGRGAPADRRRHWRRERSLLLLWARLPIFRCVSEPTHPNHALVRLCAKREEAEQYALVLVAMGIRSFVVPQEDGVGLYVARDFHDEAASELLAYDVENRRVQPSEPPPKTASPRIEVAMVFWMVLLFFFAAERNHAFSVDWLREGATQAGLMLDGEWWRAATALTLHTSSTHLLGNLVFGTVFSLLLAQSTGSGLAWLAMIVAGTLGNVANALVQSANHSSIGASTALFAGIGLLAALRQHHYTQNRRALLNLRKWAPLAGGFMLLAFLGFSGERTDVMAHVLGFAMGLLSGWLLSRFGRDWSTDLVFQLKAGGAALGILIVAWTIALAV